MSKRSLFKTFISSFYPRLVSFCLALAAFVVSAIPAVAQESFLCKEGSLVVQGENAQLRQRRVRLPGPETSWPAIGGPMGIEINAVGFRNVDDERLLYGVWLAPNGNYGLIQIDSTGATFPLGSAGLPSDIRFDAGDVSPSGSTMYVNQAGLSPLYIVDLEAMTTTAKPITGGQGFVHDWAYNPEDNLLYGGDSTHGQLAVLNPLNGQRTDYSVWSRRGGPGLPAGVPYGGAWFNSAGKLNLYRNDGVVFVIDVESFQRVGTDENVPEASRNDAAACQFEGTPTLEVEMISNSFGCDEFSTQACLDFGCTNEKVTTAPPDVFTWCQCACV